MLFYSFSISGTALDTAGTSLAIPGRKRTRGKCERLRHDLFASKNYVYNNVICTFCNVITHPDVKFSNCHAATHFSSFPHAHNVAYDNLQRSAHGEVLNVGQRDSNIRMIYNVTTCSNKVIVYFSF